MTTADRYAAACRALGAAWDAYIRAPWTDPNLEALRTDCDRAEDEYAAARSALHAETKARTDATPAE